MDGGPLTLPEARPIVSVCVANYNGRDVIRRCLRSLREQGAGIGMEVLVYDDASSDGSRELVRDEFPEVRLIAGERNVGFCMANNRMVDAARGDYLLLLNNDAWLESDALATLLAASDAPGDPVLTLPQLDAVNGQLLDCGMGMDLLANPIPLQQRREQQVATVMGACLWISRACWDQCGGFPEWFESIGEDMYLCNYARLLGHPVRALGNSAYHHHVGHSFGGGKVQGEGLVTTYRRRRLSERNKLFVMYLFYPLPGLLPLLPLQLLALFAEGVLLALLKWERRLFTEIYGHALWSLCRQWPRLWRERRAIQARRNIGTGMYFSVFSAVPYKLRMLLRHGLPRLD